MTHVIHLPDRDCFKVETEHGDAFLQYLLEHNQINFYRTFVPENARGQGIAEALVKAGLEWAKDNDFEIEASCWYVAKFLK